jgi:hypothetical protein
MSKHNNVNPGQYKVAGREKPGKPLGPENEDKERFSRSLKHERRSANKERGNKERLGRLPAPK